MSTFDPTRVLHTVTTGPGRPRLAHVRKVPARAARTTPLPPWLHGDVAAALRRTAIGTLWVHQREAVDLLHEGHHCVLATGTASGKTLAYHIPLLHEIAESASGPGTFGATALYLAPTKALAADQLARLEAWAVPGVRGATYDGDTPGDERAWIRRHANVVLTNPDMLHHALLPGHERWGAFLRGLRFVVVDECHTYRGLLGSHVAAVLRRLRRVAAAHRASPTFAFASATVAAPGTHTRTLIGESVREITDDASPREATTFAFLEPTSSATPLVGSDDRPERPSTLVQSGRLLADLVVAGVQTVVFARSRLGVEVVAEHARHLLDERGLDRTAVAAYRGGYLPEERRGLERDLRSGRLRGLATTSALELGIDISGLDAVVLAGWPGTRASLWQRAGRAGRAGRESLTVFLPEADPLDAYVVAHPESVFEQGVEEIVLDPDNPHVLAPHLAAAAAEVPLTPADEALFGRSTVSLARQLTAQGVLRRRPGGWYWTRPERPSDLVFLRGAAQVVRIVEERTGRVLGTVDAARADTTVHEGAVYLHQGEPHVVTRLDAEERAAFVVRGDPGWTTQARVVSAFDLGDVERTQRWGTVTMGFGGVRVRTRVTSFLRRLPTGEVIGEHALDGAERVLATKAVWWTVPEAQLVHAGLPAVDIPGAAHAAEHAAIGLLPLLAWADRWDIGGVSTACHPDTGLPTVLVYDGHPGGAGFAARGLASASTWLGRTRDTVAACGCSDGCPACVQSPKCGNGNEPLDKAGALVLLGVLLQDIPNPPAARVDSRSSIAAASGATAS